MQLSQFYQGYKLSYLKGFCTACLIAGVSLTITTNRIESLLITLGIVPVAIQGIYNKLQQEHTELQSQIEDIISQNELLDLKLEQAFIGKEKTLSFSKKLQQENRNLQESYQVNQKVIQQLQIRTRVLEQTVSLLQESFEYYEKEITQENQNLAYQNQELQKENSNLQKQKPILLSKKIECDRDIQKNSQQNIDLSNFTLGIIGGHTRVQNAVIKDLKLAYNLGKAVTIISEGKDKLELTSDFTST